MKTINAEIVVAYSKCPYKAFLLLCTNKRGAKHEYTEILEKKRHHNQCKYLATIYRDNNNSQPYSFDNLYERYDILTDCNLYRNHLEAYCPVLRKVMSKSDLGDYSYVPLIFVGTHSIKKEQKLKLYFLSHVLEQLQNYPPASGMIIGIDEISHKVKLDVGPETLRPLLLSLHEWLEDTSPAEPPLILNKHCIRCQFRKLCQAKAKQDDNLSLIDSISTQKAITKYEKKGIFTIKQLSYTFKPRKRKKRYKNPTPITHKPELQALAIRENKIYLQKMPELSRQPLELFLDIEGIPDQQFYYLMGLLVKENSVSTYYPFWAATRKDEAQMWYQFLDMISKYPNAPIYHYGSFEPRTLAKMAKRYNTDGKYFTTQLVNINKQIFGNVYFPLYSNRLKEIGGYLGAKWTDPNASGLQSLVWRHHWDETNNIIYKKRLFLYNEEDCRALNLLTDELSKIEHSANTLTEVDFVNQPKQRATEEGEVIHNQFEMVLNFSHADYDRKKICFHQNDVQGHLNSQGPKKRGAKIGRISYKRIIPKPNAVIRVPRRRKCPKHKNETLIATDKMAERTIIDLVFTKSGFRKYITKYYGSKCYCRKCHRLYNPNKIQRLGNRIFGWSFQAWVIYHRIFLRLPYHVVTQVIDDQFNERISAGTIVNFQKYFSEYYSTTEHILLQRILENSFVHVDETKINIQGIDQYVWVFTDGSHVIFKLTSTREATIVHEILSRYHGILISDFYPGFDSVQCKQQKCWGHLIRDLNGDLWANPFDIEFENFVSEVRNLIIPIMESVKRYGLKKRNLHKFIKKVELFYKRVIADKLYKSELTQKYRDRFIKHKASLFTFLEHNEIPWHNNMAERALRHLAVQRKISGSFFEYSAHQYLLLLGIMQTCKFQNKSFLKFLLSGEKNIDQFKQPRRRKNTKPVVKNIN